MKNFTLLGGLSPAQFLRDYWHKKPLLIRQALPGFRPLLSPDALFEMAARDDVESRLITHFKQEWKVENGPVTSVPDTAKKDWTLLVQGVNLHDDAIDALLRQFRFIPDTRLDDLMISYATDTGGVGPHYDSYDVFLLQAHGKRQWKIGAGQDLTLVQGSALKILKNFAPDQEFILEPGDMLYLPPQYAHEGTAIGECMTYSIGFRAPVYQELGEAFLQFMADSIDLPGRYADADLVPTRHPAEISKNMLSNISDALNKVRFTEDDIAIFVGEHLSDPKANVFFESPARPLTLPRFTASIAKRGVSLSRKTQMLYRGKHVFINGESFAAGREDKISLCALADQRKLDGAAASAVSADVLEALYTWYEDGWINLG
ncbi:cupin domain-containing protein [Glaciimonas immobilis]|uniref:50S ribosomal protein L16 3-hydroxylase n=1 Tax=Glaciimonas immobilis TaxID=728004 RepID=A0A840RVI4_9BURK|nr:cupin domain-containing protein [Glaciimonas immobilis]KAF3998262.1 cupin domain-containing protein [Glaciimonas immobilis]MBB5201875.1 50S ribosomal protein L16 3-hydroxylase [Glaciimonas immobilis]